MEYQIVSGNNASELQTNVVALIALGWRPLGGVSVCYAAPFIDPTGRGRSIDGGLGFFQAMTK